MRIALQHAAIHESAGIAFVGIADDIFLCSRRPWTPCSTSDPWDNRRRRARADRSCTTSSITSRRRHLGEGVKQGSISVGGDVLFDPLGIDYAGVLQDDFLVGAGRMELSRATQALDRLAWPRPSSMSRRVTCRSPACIVRSAAGRDQRSLGAQSHATHTFDLASDACGARRATSLSSASFTAWLWQERHPAATQTLLFAECSPAPRVLSPQSVPVLQAS